MIVLTGASASGKTEVAKILILKYGVQKVVTHTTRPIRVGEVDGVDYHFVSKEEFLRLNAEGFFVESTNYHDNYYGTSRQEIRSDKAVIVDPNGVQAFQALRDQGIVIFRLVAKEITRFNRMIMRGDDLSNIKIRIQNDKIWFSEERYRGVDFTIDTEDITIEEVADQVYRLYQNVTKNLR